MKRLLKYLAIFVGIGLLVGCTSREDANRDLRKRLAILNDVYQTEKVEDLFKLFPNGFKVRHRRRHGEREITIDLVGDENSRQINGVATLEEGFSKSVKIIDKQPVQYVDGHLQAVSGEELPEEIQNERFLFQAFDLTKDFYETATFEGMKSGYGPASSDYSLRYYFVDANLAKYLNVSDESKLLVSLSGSYNWDESDKVYKWLYVSDQNSPAVLSETIEGKE